MRIRLLTPFLVLLASCGTMFNGSSQTVTFSSDPPGAKVFVNGIPMGATPFQVSLPSDKDHNVEFRLSGHEPRSFVIDSKLEAVWLILDIVPGFFFGIIPLVVDAATGDWHGLSQDHLHASLDAARPQT